MKGTRDVSTAYVLRSILICGVSVLYQLLLIPMRTNGCVHFVHATRTLQLYSYQLSEVEDVTGEI